MAFAVVRVRGSEQAGGRVERTLNQLRLNRLNHLVFLKSDATSIGMLEKVKDYVTWGEPSAEVIAKVLIKKGEPIGKRKKLTDEFIKTNNEKFKSIISFAKAIQSDEARLGSINNLQPVIRLHPPRGGYENVKRSYKMGGSLGYRGKDIDALLERMIAPVKGD